MMTSGLQLNWHCHLAADLRMTLFSRILKNLWLQVVENSCYKEQENFLNIFERTTR